VKIARGILAFVVAATLASAPSLAVERKAPAKKPAAPPKVEKPEPQPQTDSAPPYEAQLTRLAEIMGALAYLRGLCGDGDGSEYRARMSALLDAETNAADRREKLAGAYNRGYRGYEATYRSCTPNAQVVIARYLDEGGRIAHEISYRFGGS
jgi:uncharacterized protein (TIGR02301 family)